MDNIKTENDLVISSSYQKENQNDINDDQNNRKLWPKTPQSVIDAAIAFFSGEIEGEDF